MIAFTTSYFRFMVVCPNDLNITETSLKSVLKSQVRDLAPFGVELDFLVEEYASSRGNYPPARHTKK